MNAALSALGVLTQTLRTLLLFGAVAATAVAAVDWAVRTRRINPFNGVARFMRARVEPRLAGVERQVVRAGGRPSMTPWWMLLAYVVIALLVLAAVDLIVSLIADVVGAMTSGPLGILLLLIRWTFGFLSVALMVRVLSSWFPRLATSRWTSWSYGATEWMLRPLRAVLPPFGPVDVSPIVAYFALWVLQMIVESALRAAM
jgi:YggT family protein